MGCWSVTWQIYHFEVPSLIYKGLGPLCVSIASLYWPGLRTRLHLRIDYSLGLLASVFITTGPLPYYVCWSHYSLGHNQRMILVI
jgi:hypothetical protein